MITSFLLWFLLLWVAPGVSAVVILREVMRLRKEEFEDTWPLVVYGVLWPLGLVLSLLLVFEYVFQVKFVKKS